jgi:hypothetical protein
MAASQDGMLLGRLADVLNQSRISFFMVRNQRRRLLRNQRRVGETITIASGIGLALLGSFLGVQFVSYGGLCIAGLGIISIIWR